MQVNTESASKKTCLGYVVPYPDYSADGMYDLFCRKITDAPRKPLENCTLEDNCLTNGKPLRQNLFGGELDEPIKYDTRINYLHPKIGKIIGGRYKICNVIHHSDDAPKVNYFAPGLPYINDDENNSENKRPSQMNDLPPAKKFCI